MNVRGRESIPCAEMRFVVAGMFALGAVALACSPAPNRSNPVAPDGSDGVPTAPEPTEVAFGQVIGAWRPAPIKLGDPQIAVISDACAAAARAELGEAEANLPTALVDSRGENVATAILADEERAIECRTRIDGQGGVTIDLVHRLAPSAVAAVDGGALSVSSLVEVPDREGDRMLIIGRVGAKAFGVKLGFDDDTEVFASSANGWYAAWWPGHARASAIVAVDNRSLVIGTAEAPVGQVDGRLGPATWWLNPRAPAPTASSTTINGFVREGSCASGRSPEGRVEGPLFDLTETAVTVTFGVRPLPGGQDCQGNPLFPVIFRLPEPLAERVLLDGNGVPPRDASRPPAG